MTISLQVACIPIPVNYYASGSRENVSKSDLDKFQKSQTTRRQVLKMLGEPDWSNPDETEFRYRWSKVKVVGLLLAPNSGAGYDYAVGYVMVVHFDAKGILDSADVTGNLKAPKPI